MYPLYIIDFMLLTHWKEFRVIETPSKTYELISDYNKNILTNSKVHKMEQFNFIVYSRKYEGTSKPYW